ncbi:MAG: HAD family phosphatase [bacterium]|nr:HAD family phosphatase [bacterium]
MIKAVIFDMNGIIIDDEHIHELAFSHVVQRFGIEISHELYLECCAGRTDRAGFETIAERFSVPLPIDAVLVEKSQAYLTLFPKTKKAFPGVLELLHSLEKTDLTLALVSSASRIEVELVIKEFGLTNTFVQTISADDVTLGKPDPEPYQKMIRLLGLKADECVVIEDSRNGVLSAKAAGCACVAVTTTHEREDLLEADLTVDRFEELDEDKLRAVSS